LSTSIPPAVLSNPPPPIPRAPKVPAFGRLEGSAFEGVVPSPRGTFRPPTDSPTRRRFFPLRLAVAKGTLKNVGWALLPVLGASLFAVRLYTKSEASIFDGSSASGVPAAATLSDWLLDEQQVVELVAAKLVGAGPTCAGPASTSELSPILSPEQLAPVVGDELSHPVTTIRSGSAQVAASSFGTSHEGKASRASVPRSSAASAPSGGSGFDPDAARVTLRFAIARARNCSNAGVSGSALITFGPSGAVQKVQLGQLTSDDADPGCVSRAFASARVPPFSGSPVIVRKRF